MTSFQPSLPLNLPRPRPRPYISSRTPRLTAETPSSPPPSSPPPLTPKKPHPLASPNLTTPLFRSLYSIINSETPPESLLEISKSLSWHTPLFDLSGTEISNTLSSFLEFAISPTVTITSVDIPRNSFSWILSFTYPLPWRPRVTIAISSTTDSFETPTRITDSWFVHPISLVRQALPRLVDIIWLYPGPHAETDIGLRKLLSKRGRYSIERFAGRAEIRIRGNVKDYERELMFANPTLPTQAFEGGLRRREKYSTVSPVAVREIDDSVEWAVRIPGEFCGSAKRLLPIPKGDDVNIVNVDERIVLVDRFGGVAMRDIVEKRRNDMVQFLEEMNIYVTLDRFWIRCYESKVGFNENGVLAIAMYGSSKGVPRRNEIVVDVTDLVDEDFWNGR